MTDSDLPHPPRSPTVHAAAAAPVNTLFGIPIAPSKADVASPVGGLYWEFHRGKKQLWFVYGSGNSAVRTLVPVQYRNMLKNLQTDGSTVEARLRAIHRSLTENKNTYVDSRGRKFNALGISMFPSTSEINNGQVGTFYGVPLYSSNKGIDASAPAVAYFQNHQTDPQKIDMKVTGAGLPKKSVARLTVLIRKGLLKANLEGKKRENSVYGVFRQALKNVGLRQAAQNGEYQTRRKDGKKAVERSVSATPRPENRAMMVVMRQPFPSATLDPSAKEKMRSVAKAAAAEARAPVAVVFTLANDQGKFVAVSPWTPPEQRQNQLAKLYAPRLYTLEEVLRKAHVREDTNVAIAHGASQILDTERVFLETYSATHQKQQLEKQKKDNLSNTVKKHLMSTFAQNSAAGANVRDLQKFFSTLFAQTGYLKHKILGPVGAYTDLSVNDQIKDMVSGGDRGFDWCKFSTGPRGLVWEVDGMHIHPLQPWQAVVYAMAGMRAQALLAKGGGRSPASLLPAGLLAHHSTGSGKTLTLLSVLIAFWNSRNMTIMPLAVRSNAADNNLRKLAILARRHFPFFRNSAFPELPEFPFAPTVDAEVSYMALAERLVQGYIKLAGENAKVWLTQAGFSAHQNDRMKRFRSADDGTIREERLLYSYQILANDTARGKVFPQKITNTVFLCDEIQYLVGAPASSEVSQVEGYKAARKALQTRDGASCWAVGATATPGNNAQEFLDILSLLAKKTITKENLKTEGYGLISYANLLGSKAQFAPLLVRNECVDVQSAPHFWKWFALKALGLQPRKGVNTKFTMPDGVRANILNSIGHPKGKKIPTTTTVNSTWQYDSQNPAKYLSRFRLIANFIRLETVENKKDIQYTPFLNTYVERVDMKTGVKRIRPTTFVMGPKLMLLLKRIKEHPNRLHYVYATDLNTLFLIAALLERDLNMTMYRKGLAPGRKTFGFVDSNTSKQSTKAFEKYCGYTKEQAATVKQRASADDNRSGKYVSVLLATKDSFKGVDVKNITHLHLLDAFADWQRLQQFLGRGPRMCSHAKFSNAIVKVHVYKLADKTDGIRDAYVFADRVLWGEAWKRYWDEWNQLEKSIRAVAVDALVFRPFTDKVEKLGSSIKDACTLQDLQAPRMRNLRQGPAPNNNNNNDNDALPNANAFDNNNNSNNTNNNTSSNNSNGRGKPTKATKKQESFRHTYAPLNFDPHTRSTRSDPLGTARRELASRVNEGHLNNSNLKNFIAKHRAWKAGGISPVEEEKLIQQHRRLKNIYSNAFEPLANNVTALPNTYTLPQNAELAANSNSNNESNGPNVYDPRGNSNNSNNNNNNNNANEKISRSHAKTMLREIADNNTPPPSANRLASTPTQSVKKTLQRERTAAERALKKSIESGRKALKKFESNKAKALEVAIKKNANARKRYVKVPHAVLPSITAHAAAIMNWNARRTTLDRELNANQKSKHAAVNVIQKKIENAEKEKAHARAQRKRNDAAAKLERAKKHEAARLKKERDEAARAHTKKTLQPFENALGRLQARKKTLLLKKSKKNGTFTPADGMALRSVSDVIKFVKKQRDGKKSELAVQNVMQSMLNKLA